MELARYVDGERDNLLAHLTLRKMRTSYIYKWRDFGLLAVKLEKL